MHHGAVCIDLMHLEQSHEIRRTAHQKQGRLLLESRTGLLLHEVSCHVANSFWEWGPPSYVYCLHDEGIGASWKAAQS